MHRLATGKHPSPNTWKLIKPRPHLQRRLFAHSTLGPCRFPMYEDGSLCTPGALIGVILFRG